jgi:outer membrane protein assembly factor BamB
LSALGASVLLAGCGSGYNQAPPKPLPPNPQKVTITQAWSHGVGGGGGDQLLGLAAASVNDTVVAASAGGHVVAFNAKTGKRVWSRHLDARLSGGPAVGHGLVVVGTRDGTVIALNAQNGKKLWTQYVDAPLLSNPAIGEKIVAVKTIAGDLIGLSPDSGESLWQVSETPPSLSLRFGIQPLIVDGVVYGGFADGSVIAVNAATGKQQWKSQVGQPSGNNPVANLINVGGVMSWASGDLYATTYQGRLAALSSFGGEVLWSHDVSSYTGATLDTAFVYVSDSSGEVHAYDLASGVPKWTYKKLGHRRLSAVTPFGSVVAVGDRFGWLHCLSRDAGDYLGRVRVSDAPIRMSPLVAGGHLIVLADDGTLAAYDVTSASTK